MIVVDHRVGSIELQPLIAARGVPTRVETLEVADYCFSGHGPDPDAPAMIGVERKRLRDFITSVRGESRRLSGLQIPGMLDHYDFSFLIVEGGHRRGESGALETYQWKSRGYAPLTIGGREVEYDEFHHAVMSIAVLTPVKVILTRTPDDTVSQIVAVYSWFNGKTWKEHRSTRGIYTQPAPVVSMYKPPLVRRVANQLPDVGYEWSGALANHFGTTRRMIEADAGEWARVEMEQNHKTRGRVKVKFGKVRTEKIMRAIDGIEEG